MIFRTVAPDENFDLLKLESAEGRWHLGLRRMLFGVRVCGNPAGEMFYTFDYCAGPVAQDIAQLLAVMRRIMWALPESAQDADVARILPGYDVRPVLRDARCMASLYALAAALEAGEDSVSTAG